MAPWQQLLLIFPILATAFAAQQHRIVCYYTNWSAYRQGPAKFLPDNINPYLCTHLIYAFGGIQIAENSGLKPFDKYQDLDKGGYQKFNNLKSYNKDLKTLLAIGGWNEGSARFSQLVASEQESRLHFIKNSIKFLRQYNFDGLDLDWEYPGSREGSDEDDKDNYSRFIQEFYEEFRKESLATKKPRLLLTIAVPAGEEWIEKGFDVKSINENVDFFNLLTYDFHASTEPTVNHHAALSSEFSSEYDYKAKLNVQWAVEYYLEKGAEGGKLVVGIPTYGRSYTLFNKENYGVGAGSSGPGKKGKFTKEPGYLAYYEICEGLKTPSWTPYSTSSDHTGPHAVYNSDQWVGYDDPRIVSLKSKWVKDKKLGGIMFWSIDNDDFRGGCHGNPFPLIEAGKNGYLKGEISGESIRPQNSVAKSTNRQQNNNKRKKRPKSTTTVSPLYTTTPSPPTTPSTLVDFECRDEGFFPHPSECKKYFWCLDAPGLGLVAHHFTCPAGLYFNKNSDSCDYTRNVKCKPGGVAITTTTTTTTTTTAAPPPVVEYEYYDEEEDVEDDDDDPPPTGAGSGKSVSQINDIKDLLSIIKKLGGVSELEKYLQENPEIAKKLEEENSGVNLNLSVNRFNTNSRTVTTTTTTTRRPPLNRNKYTSIQRSTKRPTVPPPSTSSTATSVVTRYTDDDKLDEEIVSKPYSRVSDESVGGRKKIGYTQLERGSGGGRRKATSTTTSAPPSDDYTLEEVDDEEYYQDEEPVTIATTTTTPRSFTRIRGRTTAKPVAVATKPTINSNRRNLFRRTTTTTKKPVIAGEEDDDDEVGGEESIITTQVGARLHHGNRFTTAGGVKGTTTPLGTISSRRRTTKLPLSDDLDFSSTTMNPNRRRTTTMATTTRRATPILTKSLQQPTTPKNKSVVTMATSTTKKPKLVAYSNDYYYYYYDDDDDNDQKKSPSQSLVSINYNQIQKSPPTTISSSGGFQRRSLEIEPLKISPPQSTNSLPLSAKIKYSKSSIECLDVGTFPHPNDCAKYVNCPGTGLPGLVINCPPGLSYESVGGMCNWGEC